jgi:hypothetical protein
MIQINKGSVLIYRVFDVAEEVDLQKVDALIKSGSERARLKFTRSPRQVVIMRNAPVMLNLGESEVAFEQSKLKVEVHAKIWDYGVISILFQVPISEGTSWEQLIELAAKIDQDKLLDQAAIARAKEVAALISPASRDPHFWSEFEDYVIFFLEDVKGITKTSELPERADLPRLLIAETANNLSARSRASILENGIFQYTDDDLAVIDWNSAVVVEPTGSKEVPEVLEFALTHMLEMRYYDELIDTKLTILYDSIEESRGRFFTNQFTHLSKEASTRYIEFSEFIERVDNSFKVVGDFYLAKIFRAAGEKFSMPEWETNISRKINLFSSLSELLQGEVNVNRSLWLEVTVVVLILFELVTAIFKIHPGR